ncbi:MAG: hypothetical protein KAV87_00095 [Desulfobacteraceae bacterium]|nr:hypothetical protein [Desulfobacteraceae bacterium]
MKEGSDYIYICTKESRFKLKTEWKPYWLYPVQYFVPFTLDSGNWFKNAFPFFWSYGWIDC